MWGEIASAGIGALGGMLGGNEEHIGPGDYVPDWLKSDWQNLGGQIGDLQTPQYYQDQMIASQNPWMQDALGGMAGYGAPGGMGGMAANQMFGAGSQALAGIGQGMDYMSGLQDRGPNQFQYDQGTYDQMFGNLTGGMQNAFDVGAQQMQQGFDWGTLPGLNMEAALGGAQGSTKQFQQGALGQAMTNQAIQQFGTDMWQNAANQAAQAGMSAGAQNLAGANAFDQSMMGNYQNFGQLGGALTGQGYDMGRSNLGLGLQAGQIQQGYDQSQIDADMAKWNFEQQAPWTALDTQLGMINQQKMGGAPGNVGLNPWEGLLQGAQTGLNVYNAGQEAFGWGGGGGGDVLDFQWSPFEQGSAWDESF